MEMQAVTQQDLSQQEDRLTVLVLLFDSSTRASSALAALGQRRC